MPKQQSARIKQLKEALVKIKEANLLPMGYAQTIADKLGIDRNTVYQTMKVGGNSKLEIMTALIELAEDNEEVRLLERANKLLEKSNKK